MIERVLFASGYAFAAGVQPGPLQAFLLSRVARDGWRRTLPASLSPLLSDGPIALLALLVLGRLPQGAGRILQAAGGVLLLYFGVSALLPWKRQPGSAASLDDGAHAPRTLAQAALVNLLNPNPYLGWSLVLGPAVVSAWRASAAQAVAFVAAFYATMVVTLGLTILAFGATSLLTPGARRMLVLVSAIILGALGVHLLAAGLAGR